MTLWKKIVLICLAVGWCVGYVAAAEEYRVDRYIQQLKDNTTYGRAQAAEALGALGDPRAVEPLTRARLRDNHSIVRHWAAQALEKILGKRE